MESNSKPNRIQCSENSKTLLDEQGCKYPIKPRGIIQVKGKGDMKTYWINEGSGAVPPPMKKKVEGMFT